MKTIAFIFARGGSKGVKRKNIKLLGGEPLIAHSIKTAKQSNLIDEIYVSTEDKEIADISRGYGAQIIKRPRELAQDDSPEWLSWQHAVDSIGDFDIFISLPPTSPFRNLKDIELGIKKINKEPDADIVISISRTNRSPWFNMVKIDQEGYARLVDSSGGGRIKRRQDAPVIYDITTVSLTTKPLFVKNNFGMFDGKVKTIEIPQERSLDIDSEFDFEIAEALFSLRHAEQ